MLFGGGSGGRDTLQSFDDAVEAAAAADAALDALITAAGALGAAKLLRGTRNMAERKRKKIKDIMTQK